MIAPRRGQSGFTLVEVLVVGALSIVLLGGVLTSFVEFDDVNEDRVRQNEAQQKARQSIDDLQRELRNLASPTNELPQAVEKATSTDLVFQSIAKSKPQGSQNARNAQRVRYCLDAPGGRVWRQDQTWTTAAAPALPATTACPQAPVPGNWSQATVAAREVTNGARAVFEYDSAQLDEITEVGVKLYVDADPAERPAEVELASGAFLRNQNRAPSASFTATLSGTQIVLNGSASVDPEGRALTYRWFDGAVEVGEGIVFTYTPATGGNRSMQLRVSDPAGLEDTAPAQVICVPGLPCL